MENFDSCGVRAGPDFPFARANGEAARIYCASDENQEAGAGLVRVRPRLKSLSSPEAAVGQSLALAFLTEQQCGC